MKGTDFPIYRALGDHRSVFHIISPVHFIEVQRVGTRYLVHEITAHTYPEKRRIAELITCEDGSSPIEAAEFHTWLRLARRGSSRSGHP